MKTSTYIKSLITRHGVDGAVSYLKSLDLVHHPVIRSLSNYPRGCQATGRDGQTVDVGVCKMDT